MNTNKLVKILVPLGILLVIVGIWFFKNTPLKPSISASEAAFPLEVTAIDLEALQAHKLPLIIDFGAAACGPCQAMAPTLVKLNQEMQNKAIITYVDVWKNTNAAADFPVQVVPTQVFYTAAGKPYIPKEDLGVEFIMYSTKDTNQHIFTVHQGVLTEEELRSILQDMGVE